MTPHPTLPVCRPVKKPAAEKAKSNPKMPRHANAREPGWLRSVGLVPKSREFSSVNPTVRIRYEPTPTRAPHFSAEVIIDSHLQEPPEKLVALSMSCINSL